MSSCPVCPPAAPSVRAPLLTSVTPPVSVSKEHAAESSVPLAPDATTSRPLPVTTAFPLELKEPGTSSPPPAASEPPDSDRWLIVEVLPAGAESEPPPTATVAPCPSRPLALTDPPVTAKLPAPDQVSPVSEKLPAVN